MQTPTLLCIDDEPSGLQLRKILLERNGYSVITACSGQQGLELFAARDVDLVILDYYMPGMHGDEVAAAIKQQKPQVPIIMLSAFVFANRQALASVDTYLTKGESPSILLGAIGKLLDRNESTPDQRPT